MWTPEESRNGGLKLKSRRTGRVKRRSLLSLVCLTKVTGTAHSSIQQERQERIRHCGAGEHKKSYAKIIFPHHENHTTQHTKVSNRHTTQEPPQSSAHHHTSPCESRYKYASIQRVVFLLQVAFLLQQVSRHPSQRVSLVRDPECAFRLQVSSIADNQEKWRT